jgi:DNA-binding NarL/FixJ family response regulator
MIFSKNNNSIRVLLADDSAVVRRPIRALLEKEPSIQFVGEAGSLAETIEMVGQLQPDLVILDMHMPDDQRFTPGALRIALSDTEVIATSVYMDDETKIRADAVGARKFLDKSELGHVLIPAILSLK